MQQTNAAVQAVAGGEDPASATEGPSGGPALNVIDLRAPARQGAVPGTSSAALPSRRPHDELSDDEFARTFHRRVLEGRRDAELLIMPNGSPLSRAVKRAMDLAIAIPAIIVLAPVMAVLAVMVRLDSPGKAVFWHLRAGQDGHLIKFHKFRTMYTDSRERFPEMFRYDFEPDNLAEAYYKPQDESADPRVTRFGRFLRRSSLDELPNLFNVVRGTVSIVGPRPELLGVLRYYQPEQMAKFSVKPGMTGLAACSGRNDLTVEQQIAYDLEYVAKQSTLFDLRIIVRTAKAVLQMEGAA